MTQGVGAGEGGAGGANHWQCFECLLKGREGEYRVSSNTPVPHSAPLRATQVLAKERGNQGNPKTDKKTLKCYS